eukprot:gene3925-2793_t
MSAAEQRRIQHHLEEDQEYIRDCDLKGLLKKLVRDTARDRPENMYEYMHKWALEQQKMAQCYPPTMCNITTFMQPCGPSKLRERAIESTFSHAQTNKQTNNRESSEGTDASIYEPLELYICMPPSGREQYLLWNTMTRFRRRLNGGIGFASFAYQTKTFRYQPATNKRRDATTKRKGECGADTGRYMYKLSLFVLSLSLLVRVKADVLLDIELSIINIKQTQIRRDPDTFIVIFWIGSLLDSFAKDVALLSVTIICLFSLLYFFTSPVAPPPPSLSLTAPLLVQTHRVTTTTTPTTLLLFNAVDSYRCGRTGGRHLLHSHSRQAASHRISPPLPSRDPTNSPQKTQQRHHHKRPRGSNRPRTIPAERAPTAAAASPSSHSCFEHTSGALHTHFSLTAVEDVDCRAEAALQNADGPAAGSALPEDDQSIDAAQPDAVAVPPEDVEPTPHRIPELPSRSQMPPQGGPAPEETPKPAFPFQENRETDSEALAPPQEVLRRSSLPLPSISLSRKRLRGDDDGEAAPRPSHRAASLELLTCPFTAAVQVAVPTEFFQANGRQICVREWRGVVADAAPASATGEPNGITETFAALAALQGAAGAAADRGGDDSQEGLALHHELRCDGAATGTAALTPHPHPHHHPYFKQDTQTALSPPQKKKKKNINNLLLQINYNNNKINK